MTRRLYFILLVVPAEGSIFGKRAATPPEKRVPELIHTLKSDTDEGKRSAAAAEMRDYDAKKFPDMMRVLIDALQNDTKPSVRREAAISLGRLRPITAAAGQALQRAAAKDPSLRVRVQAWSSLKIYQLNGYNARMKDSPAPAAPAPATSKSPGKVDRTATPGKTSTKEPPLAEPDVRVTDSGSNPPASPPVMRQPAPSPPRNSRFAPRNQQRPAPTPPAPSVPAIPDDGPMLVPPGGE